MTEKVTPLRINDKTPKTPNSAEKQTERSQTSFSSTRFKSKTALPLETLQNASKISQRKTEIDKLVSGVLSSPKNQESFRSHVTVIAGKKLFGDQTTGILTSKAKICIDALCEGCIDAFILLFDMINKPPSEHPEEDFKIPTTKLNMIKQLLCDAETNRRQGDFEAVYFTYKKLADYFESEKDDKTAMFFYNNAQDVAKASSDPVLESIAQDHIGAYYARNGALDKSIKAYETHLSFLEPTNTEMIQKARNSIIDVCIKYAVQKEEEAMYNDAVVYYEKALKLSAVSHNKEMGSKCIFYLGKLFEKMQDFERSTATISQYMNECMQNEDIQGQLDAIELLATIYEKSNQQDQVLSLHTQYLKLAESIGDVVKQGLGCEKLGKCMLKAKNFDTAVQYFERNFDLANQSKNEGWIQRAKVNLGFARGEAKMHQKMK